MQDFTSTRTISAYKGAVPEKITINFKTAHLSQDAIEEYAMRGIVIQAQAAYRAWLASDKSKPSPIANNIYNTPVPGTRTADPEKTLAKAASALKKVMELKGMSLEELADYLENLK